MDSEEGGERCGGGGGNIVVVPLKTLGIDLPFDLGDWALLDFRRFGEGQDEWLDALQLLTPIFDLFIAKFSTTIGSPEQPVTEIGVWS